MKQFLFNILFIVLLVPGSVSGQEQVQMVTQFDSISYLFEPDAEKVQIVNFWATWCAPCVRELPYIEALHDEYDDEEIKVTLVSLDLKRDREKKVIPFLTKNEIQSDVLMLLDSKMNTWIDQVDPNWSGAIPLTCIVGKENYECYEQEFHSVDEIITLINKLN